MLWHVTHGLSLIFYNTTTVIELNRFLESHSVTHLFVGSREYRENKEYIDHLAAGIAVAVFADPAEREAISPSVIPLQKPFYSAQIASFINNTDIENASGIERGRMVCPGLCVLVVDDEPMNLLVARGIFETYEMKVDTAPGGWEAIEACEEKDYDVIFMDHMMPQMDGVEAAKRIRRLSTEKKQVIVALTANAVSGAREMFLSEGFDEFISKPIELTVLERVLRKVLPASSINYVMEEKREEQQHDALFDPGFSSLPKPASTVSFGAVESTAKPLAPRSAFIKSLSDMGLDADAALSACMGDEEFYKDLLGIFTDEAEAMAESGDVAGISSFSELIGLASGEVSEARIMTMVRGIRTVLGKH
jgi:CheY-like chemotaxis protein